MLPVAAKLLSRVAHDLIDGELEEEVEFLELLVTLNRLLHVTFRDGTRHLTVSLGPLPQLLPFSRVTGCCYVGGGLLGEDVLNGQNFVEELKLLFSGSTVRIRDNRSVILHKNTKIIDCER